MKEKFYRLYLKLVKPEAYGALLECERLKKELEKARRWHQMTRKIERKFYEARALFETLRK